MEKSAAPSLASQQSSNGIAMAPKSVEDIDACVTPTSFSSPKAKNKGLRNWIHDHQLLFSVTGIIAIVLLHTLSSPFQRHAGPFIELSYFNPSQGTFGRGADDAYFVAMSVLLFTAVRAICVDYIFRPFAAARGLKPKAAIRFAEQGWQFVYYFTYWTFGMYLWTTSHYWLNFAEIWSDWPVRETSASIKIYTLSQLAFWFQQILVLNMEERRKDYNQMLFHHIITTTLLISAYAYGFFNVANVILCLMDVVDLLLPGAKMLKYLGHENACNAVFGTFFVAWLIPRHVIYNKLVWSIYQHVPSVMPYGCHVPSSFGASNSSSSSSSSVFTPAAESPAMISNWEHMLYPFHDVSGTICMSPRIKWAFVLFLVFLQVLSLIWFGMIVAVLVNMFCLGKPAEDIRSDEEDEEGNDEAIASEKQRESQEQEKKAAAAAAAVFATADGANAKRYALKKNGEPAHISSVVTSGSATGVMGGGHVRTIKGPRKELLGRIGCEKPTNA